MKLLKSFLLVVCVPTLVVLLITFVIFYHFGTIICDAEDKAEAEKQKTIETLVAQAYNGIDVSHHNGEINWKTMSQDPCVQYVYIKATEGEKYVDAKYYRNVSEAQKYGILVGAYHYFNGKTAQKQFNNFSSVVKKESIDLIPVIDVEAFGLKAYKGDWKKIRTNLLELAKLMKKYYGVQPILYLNAEVHSMLGDLSNFKIWLMPMKNNSTIPTNTVMFQRDGAKLMNGTPTDINYIEDINEILYGKEI